MDCREYRALYPELTAYPLPSGTWDDPQWDAWMGHRLACVGCSDWSMAEEVAKRGHDVASFPCVHLAHQLTHACAQHEHAADCPDVVIAYDPRFDEYFIRTDSVRVNISHCPWCGRRLPESKRDLWFEELERLGFERPLEQGIPAAFRSGEWRRARSS